MSVRLNDDQCLLWIKDPSISPFENNYVARKYRKDILIDHDVNADNALNNPKSFLNRVRRRCFYNSALRQKLVDKIKEYQQNGTLRLHTLNDKITDNFEYITPPFTIEECKYWSNNHLINPRTNEKISMAGSIYIELIYTTIQYGLPTPPILDTIPTNENDKTLYKLAKRIIEDVMLRFDFMKQNDEYFLTHNVESFDRKLKISSPLTSIRKAAAKPKNTFDVSSSLSNKSLNSAERRLLRDMKLENIEEEQLAAEYQYKKGLLPKKDVDKTIFNAFKKFLEDLQNEVMNGNQLINNILKDATDNAKSRIIGSIESYLQKKKYNDSSLKGFLKDNKLDTIEGIISNFVNNIYVQLIDPQILIPRNMEIGLLSARNKQIHFKDSKIIKQLTSELSSFIKQYFFVRDYKIKQYFINLVEDKISREFIDTKLKIYINPVSEYKNWYYTILLNKSDEKEPVIMRLPEGHGLLIGKKLTKAIIDLKDSNFNTYENRVVIDDNPLNGFTYEECKNWVILPIINPRTFKPILIDSPMYNRLLCMSYQYDTHLIPRMITSHGYDIIIALTNVIENILNKEGEKSLPQSIEQLENFIINTEAQFMKEKDSLSSNTIGLKWKNAGTKHPNGGVKIINKKILTAFRKLSDQDGEMPFYVSFSEEDLSKFGITDITKNSYIEISTYYVQVIDNNNKNRNNLGLRWKIINNEKDKEDIKRERVELINKKLKEAFLKLVNKDNILLLPARVSFSKEDLKNFGITTTVPDNRYIKFTYYYKPVFNKSISDIVIKQKSNVVITKRDSKYSIHKYYTVADCLRWANQPNRDPKRQDILIATDSKEYNAIFEQALLYDYNITPINITSKGIKFMKSVIKTKGKVLNIASYSIKHEASKSLDITEINSKICNSIREIYDNETNEEGKKYNKFKNNMIQKCKHYNKEPSLCINVLKDEIKNKFLLNKKKAKENKLKYYQDSALASLLIYYEGMYSKIYNEEIRDIFINDFNKFYIYIYELDNELKENKKDAIDAGGPKREFFTKLFEELFCDDEHFTRPFICPKDIIGNIYYINPNFAPDENFKKVIRAYKQNHSSILNFDTERDYEYIYFVIGKLLCLTVVNDVIGLPQQLSSYILSGLINQKNQLNYYDILYFYLREFNNAIYYINMISNNGINNIEYAGLSFNDLYVVSKSLGSSLKSSGEKITKDNYIKFIIQQSKHVITKNFLGKEEVNSEKNMKMRYDSLFGGFSNEIRKFLYKKKVTIEQLSLLITNELLTIAILQELVSKINVYMEIKYTSNSFVGIYTGDRMSEAEQKERGDVLKGYMSNIITQKRGDETDEDHIEFVKNLLRFWTGLTYYDKNKTYQICYKYGVGININNLPNSHTCTYTLDIFGFNENDSPEEREKFIYDKFKLAVGEQEMELH